MKKENTETGNRTGEWKTRRRTGFLAAGLAAVLLTFTDCGSASSDMAMMTTSK